MPATTFAAANLQWVGLAPETTYGTAIAVPAVFVPVDTPAWTSPIESIDDTALRGSMAVNYARQNGLRYEQLTFKTNCYIDSAYYLLRAMLGVADTITGTPPTVTHKTSLLSASNGQPQSTTLFYCDGAGKAWQIPGAQMTDLKLTVKTSGLVELQATFQGLPATAITPPANTPTTAAPMPAYDTTISVGGTLYSKYSEIDLEWKRGTKMIPTVTGTQTPFAIFAGPLSVAGTFDGVYQGSTDNDLVANLTNQQPALIITMVAPTDLTHTLAVQCSKVAYDDAQVSGTNEWMSVKSTLTAIATAADVAAGGNLSPTLATLINTTSTAI